MSLYSQVDANGYFTHRQFTDDPNFQPQEGCRILLDNVPGVTDTHYPRVIQPTRPEATEIEYEMFPIDEDPTLGEVAQRAREDRDNKLVQWVDNITIIEWESFTEEQKQSIKEFRQNLLDVPEQANFPHNIIWPTPPEILINTITADRKHHMWRYIASMIRKDGGSANL